MPDSSFFSSFFCESYICKSHCTKSGHLNENSTKSHESRSVYSHCISSRVPGIIEARNSQGIASRHTWIDELSVYHTFRSLFRKPTVFIATPVFVMICNFVAVVVFVLANGRIQLSHSMVMRYHIIIIIIISVDVAWRQCVNVLMAMDIASQ